MRGSLAVKNACSITWLSALVSDSLSITHGLSMPRALVIGWELANEHPASVSVILSLL